MRFRLTVEHHPGPYHVTYAVHVLLSEVLGREFDFPLLLRAFTRLENRFDPDDLLAEAEVLKDIARAHRRPWIDPGRPLERFELEGMTMFPRLLRHEAQVVQDWGQLVQTGEGGTAYVPSPPTLLAGRGRLHLVDAIALQVAESPDWTAFEHLTAEHFKWERGALVADGVLVMDLPPEYLRAAGNWTELRYATVPVYDAWRDEIDDLIRACHDAARAGTTVRTTTEPPDASWPFPIADG